MNIKFLNSASYKLEDFKPLADNRVGIYSCGPTVYDYAHIGNLRAYVFADTLVRVLRFAGYKARWAMNITDIDDKTLAGAKAAGISLHEFTQKYEKEFWQDLESLNINKPDETPHATDYFKQMHQIVEILLKKGIAYESQGSIYFDISKFASYGKFAGLDMEGLKEGTGARLPARQVDSQQYDKENAKDFVLWKSANRGSANSGKDQDYPDGRPGWHLECSAMSRETLGQPFDIHTGGVDLIFPHHQNEIAQSEAAYDKPLANYFLHNEHLLVNGQKMAKSENNFYTLKDVTQKGFRPLALRYFYLENHYRAKMNFTWDGLEKAQKTLMGIYTLVANNNHGQDLSKEIDEALENDLDIPTALSILHKAGDVNLWKKYDSVLGLGLDGVKIIEKETNKEFENKIQEREELRKQKKYEQADKIREELEKEGILIEDLPSGPKVIQIP